MLSIVLQNPSAACPASGAMAPPEASLLNILMNSPTAVDGTLPIAAALTQDAASTAWDLHCDVLVVGLGAAGAGAAITACEGKAEVLVAERFEGGGATARSGGVVYAGGGTGPQQRAGQSDSSEAMFRYLQREVGEAVAPATLRRFCEDSPALIAWLESIGVSFASDPQFLHQHPKTSYPKDGIYLYYSGNEAVAEYAAVAQPAPRGHRVRGSFLSGKSLFIALRNRVQALGARVLTQSSVRRLIQDASGAVIGAELWQLPPGSAAATRHQRLMRWAELLHNVMPGRADRLRAQALALEQSQSRRLLVRARRGVVLSTGGFIFNRQMLTQHAPKYLNTMRLGATGCDGSGIRLGQSVGGSTARLDKVSAWRFINPPGPWPQGLVVNQQASRFCNEQVYGAKLGVAMCEQPGGRAWLVLDRKLRRQAIREALFGGLWAFQSIPALVLMLRAARGKTAAALAGRLGLPGAALESSIRDYNAGVAQQSDALGKSPALLQKLEAPFYAMEISAGSSTFPCPAITLGGLRVDESSGEVLDDQGQAIAGLYAAGRSAVGIASNAYVSGLSLADCLWSGRRAGHAAAARPALRVAA